MQARDNLRTDKIGIEQSKHACAIERKTKQNKKRTNETKKEVDCKANKLG
jgi:hypothetical protein